MIVSTRLTGNEVEGFRSHRLRSAGNSANVKPLRLRPWRPMYKPFTMAIEVNRRYLGGRIEMVGCVKIEVNSAVHLISWFKPNRFAKFAR
jgi:hypothetical protein